MRHSSSSVKPSATRAASSPSSATVRGPALAVNRSAVTFAPVAWQYGRNMNTETAVSISTSSTSPGSGLPNSQPLVALQAVISAIASRIRPPSSAQTSVARYRSPCGPRSACGAASFIALLRVLGDQLPRGLHQRLAVDALGLHVVDPALHHGLELLLEQVELGGGQLHVLVARLGRDGDAAVVVVGPHLAHLAQPGLARSLGERLLHVCGQLVPARLVHRHLERGVAEAHLVRPLDL